MTTIERYEIAKAKREKKMEKEERLNSFTAFSALELLLKKLGAEKHFDAAKEKLLSDFDFLFSHKTKSVYEFCGIGTAIGYIGFYFIIDLDPDRQVSFERSLERRFKKSYNLIDFAFYDDCSIAVL